MLVEVDIVRNYNGLCFQFNDEKYAVLHFTRFDQQYFGYYEDKVLLKSFYLYNSNKNKILRIPDKIKYKNEIYNVSNNIERDLRISHMTHMFSCKLNDLNYIVYRNNIIKQENYQWTVVS